MIHTFQISSAGWWVDQPRGRVPNRFHQFLVSRKWFKGDELWVSRSVAIRYHTTMAGDQMVAVVAWVDAHAHGAIDHIDVYDTFVSMEGCNSDQEDSAQTAVRSGDLTADLDEVYRRLWRLAPKRGGSARADGMDVRVNGSLTEREREELSAWLRTRDSDEIAYVIVDVAAVIIHGRHAHQNRGRSAIAVRYPGRVIGALDEAIRTLRNTR
jgi:hypothetical protein